MKKSKDIHQDSEFKLKERVKELQCMYKIFQVINRPDLSFEETLRKITDIIPSAFQYPENTCAKIILEKHEFKTKNFKLTPWGIKSNIGLKGEKRLGSLEVYYLRERPRKDESRFLKEEQKLIQTIAEYLRKITEVNRANEKLKVQRVYLERLFETAKEAIAIGDNNHRVLQINREFTRLFGYSPDEAIGQHIDDLISSDNTIKETRSYTKQVGEGKDISFESVRRRKDGTPIYVSAIGAPIIIDNKQVGHYAIYRDIDERKRATKELKEQKKRFEDVALSTADWIWEVNTEGKYTFASGNIEQILGYKPEEIIGKSPFDLMSEEEGERVGKIFNRIASEKKPIVDLENWNLTKNGKRFLILTNGVPIISEKGELLGYRGVDKDITKEKLNEEEEKQRAAQRKLLYKVGQRVSSELNLNTLLSEIVTIVRDSFNYYSVSLLLVDEKTKSLNLKTWAGAYKEILPEGIKIPIGKGMTGYAVASGKTQMSGDINQNPHYLKAAEEVAKSELSVPIYEGNKVIGVLDIQSDKIDTFNESDISAMETLSTQIASAIENARLYEKAKREITERKRWEGSLQREKAYLDQLFESAQEAIVLTDNMGKVLRVNSEFTKLFGYTPEEALGQPIDDLVSSGELKKEAGSYTKKLAEGKKIAFESLRQRKDASPIYVSAIGAPIIIGNEQIATYAIYRDITRRKSAEEDVKRREAQAALIYRVGQRVSSKLELKALLSEIVTSVQESFNYYGVMLLTLDDKAKCLNLQAIAGGYSDILPKDLSIALGEGMIGNAVTTGETQVSGDVSKNPYYVKKAGELTKSELSVPIYEGNKVIGVLDIQSDKIDTFNESDISAMETLSTQIATAIKNATLYDKAQREIIQRKNAEKLIQKEAAMLSAMISSMDEGIVFADSNGRIEEVNDYFLKLVKKDKKEILGKNLKEFHSSKNYEKVDNLINTFKKNHRLKPYVIQRPLGNLETIFRVQPIYRDNKYDGILLNISDVTDLVVSKREAQSANLAKSEFLANMSHEVRTPLNGIMGMTELLMGTKISENQHEYLDGIKKSGESLLNIINDILDFSRIESKKINIESINFNLRDSIGDMLSTLALQAHKKRLELAYHIPSEITDKLIGDPGRLRQILLNLVNNAIKFTRKGEVVINIEEKERTQDEIYLHFSVRDTGIGIPLSKQKTIFDSFSQVDGSISREYGGTGLGLAIGSQLVELMRGKIWLNSKLNKGSTFHFTARFGLQKGQRPEIIPAKLKDIEDIRVLVVDDNATNRKILKEILRNWNMKPQECSNGNYALTTMKKARDRGDPFRLALIDAHMPFMDGFTLAEKIKKTEGISNAILIILTSGGIRGDAEHCRNIGISAYLPKPIKQSDLLDTIMLSLGRSSIKENQIPLITRHTLRESLYHLRILLVEDNIINQKVALHILEKYGHKVTTASNGKEAISTLAKNNFDLILMDVQMPIMDGFKATRIIRKNESKTDGHIPIIAMTAHAMRGDRERCIKAGMDDYVSKPIIPDKLFETIEGVIKNKENLKINA